MFFRPTTLSVVCRTNLEVPPIVNGYMGCFKGWLRPFNGVASKYLPSYLSWRRTIEREGERFTPERCLQVAFGGRST